MVNTVNMPLARSLVSKPLEQWTTAGSVSFLIHLLLLLLLSRLYIPLPLAPVSIPVEIVIKEKPPTLLIPAGSPLTSSPPSRRRLGGDKRTETPPPLPIKTTPSLENQLIPLNPSSEAVTSVEGEGIPIQNEIAQANPTGAGFGSGLEGESDGGSVTGSTDGVGDSGASGTVYIPLIEVTRMPIFKTRIAPTYPEEAKRREKEGTVILDVSISATGEVVDVVVKKKAGFGFDEAAIAAMRQSNFNPAFVGDRPVAVIVRVPIQFRFKD